jgi:predicted  nucleic acid-binding Zn-ribbon protein
MLIFVSEREAEIERLRNNTRDFESKVQQLEKEIERDEKEFGSDATFDDLKKDIRQMKQNEERQVLLLFGKLSCYRF